MTDPASLATLDVLNRLCSPAQYSDLNLYTLAICQMLALTLDRGNSDASTVAYARLGMIAGFRFGEYERAYRVGQLACELVEQRGLRRFEAGVYLNFGNMGMPWTRHIRICCELIGRAFEAARNAGDQVYANVCSVMMIVNLLSAGGSLADIKREAESALAFAQRVQFGSAIEVIGVALARVRMLLGATARFGSLDDEQFDERRMERDFADTPDAAQCWYWVCKLQARFMAGDYVAALDAASRAERQLTMSFTIMEAADYHFYSALSYAASCNALPAAQRVQMVGDLASHHRQLASWAEACPENFEDRAATVGAEIARLAGRELEAEQLYDQAIRSSHANGFVQNEALANELAAQFYAARGFEKIANVYLRDARHGYARWGADGKVRQLDQLYPHINKEEAGPVDTIVAPVKYLDFATVMKISQAVSGEMIQEKLTDALMRTAIEHAGAQRGLLILAQGADYRIEAEAITCGNTMAVNPRQASITAVDLPESILRYVVRTKETVLLNDALRANMFSGDEYIQRHHARSILCKPLLKQNRLIGALYLENNLAPDAFTADRLAILSLLASQAAMSLENTRLYGDLQEREARIRRLVDSNIIGIFVWDFDGRIIDANGAFLRIVGYGRDDIVSGRLRWRDLTPAEWRDADDRCLAELEATRTTQPYEKEYFLKSGSRVPVLVGAATFGGRQDQGVAFVVDLTERKRAEEEIRESERRYSEVQMELVHANRVATMGQLSASIAHEINQPVAAAVNNASAALRWLGKEPPDLEQARQALNRIFANGNRVGEVIGRMRALFKKAPLRKEETDINGAILEVIALTRGEVVKNGISVQSHLVEGLPLIQGDRVQLQQVILNLIINAVEGLSSVSEASRELVITTGKGEPDGVLVVVRDSGPGLSSLDLERIFEAFYTTKSGGLGGLSICRSIIEAHGGRLWATAAQPQGATFQFTLPAQSNQAA